ncbi:hypothetical protein ACK4QX_22265, partial [Proteus mirabilis]
SDRINLVNTIINKIKSIKDINIYTFFYFQNKIIFQLKNLFFGKIFNSIVNFKPLTQSNVVEIMKSSRIIIDIHHPKQKGLTMRTIECLG